MKDEELKLEETEGRRLAHTESKKKITKAKNDNGCRWKSSFGTQIALRGYTQHLRNPS